jgi:parallel beta-helix repeat protein
MLAALSKLVGISPKTKARKRKTFKPRVDALEARNLMATLHLVDDDGAQFPQAQFTTIQAAVNAAQPGDIVRVAAGTYNESVLVNKRLTLIGQGASGNLSQNPQYASIVDPVSAMGIGFNLTANDIVLQGFTIGSLDVADSGTIGVAVARTTSGARISSNVIEQNTYGIDLESNGARPTFVVANTIRDNNTPGAAQGNGIYSDQGLSNAIIVSNRFTNNDNAGIILVGGGTLGAATAQSRITIAANIIENAGNGGIIMVNTTNSTVSANTLRNLDATGIFLGGGVSSTTFVGNSLTNIGFTGINLRTNAFGTSPLANTNVQILANYINNVGDSGIRLREGTTNVTVRSNVVTNARGTDPEIGNGISIETGSNNNLVESNVLYFNNRNGIFVDATGVNNTLRSNVALLNGDFDYQDLSVGTQTAGTANRWIRNVGRTQNRPGLIG